MNRVNEMKKILESMLASGVDFNEVSRVEKILMDDFEGTMLEDALAVPLGLYDPWGVPREYYYDDDQLRELIRGILPRIDSLASTPAEA